MKRSLSIILGLVVIVAVASVAVWFVWTSVSAFLALPAASQTPVAALVGVVSVPIITYFTARGLERRRSRENAIREHKTELYDSLISGFMRMLNVQRKGVAKMTQDEMVSFFGDAAPKLLTYGSRGVIRAWNNLRGVSAKKPDDALAIVWAMEDLLKAMRADLGHPTFTTPRGELVGTFINDIESEVKKAKAKIGKVTPS